MAIKHGRSLPFRIGVRSANKPSRSLTALTALSLMLILVVACSEGGDPRTNSGNSGVTPPAESVAANSPTPTPAPSATSLPTSIPDTPVPAVPTVAIIPTLTPTPTAVAPPKPAGGSDPTATTSPSGTVVPTATPTSIATVTPTLPTPTSAPTLTPVPTNTPVPPSPTPTSLPAEPTATIDPNVAVEPTATTAPPSSQELASEGAGIYETNCTGCHSRDSDTKIGPGHRNVYSRAATRVPDLSADEYIRQSLLDPGAYVVSGFPSIMPKFTFFNEQQILALIEYLKSL